ncbi:MAG: hypothetical protein MZV49_12700 [Rhodopseudomonas palustris]|nr:hypothetical protein [Rhodopseudomonas palustris]
MIYFFAPWCGVCAASSPQLRWFHRWRGDDVQVLLVGLDCVDARPSCASYATRHELTMPVLVGDPATGAAYRDRRLSDLLRDRRGGPHRPAATSGSRP